MEAKKFTQRLDDLSPEILSDDPRNVLKEMIDIFSKTKNERLGEDIDKLLQMAENISDNYVRPENLDWSWFVQNEL